MMDGLCLRKGACVPGNVPLTQPLLRESGVSVKGDNDERVECSPPDPREHAYSSSLY